MQKVDFQMRTFNAEVIAFYTKLGFEVEEIAGMGRRPAFGGIDGT